MVILDTENEPLGYELIDIDDNKADENPLLENILGELGVASIDDIMLKVYRINDMGKEAHCFDCLPAAIEGIEERLRNAYGKGDYNIKVFVKTSSGGKAVKRHIKLSIETPLEVPEVVVDKGDDLKDVVATMMDAMSKQNFEMMSMFRESQLHSQNKTQELMITVMGAQKSSEQGSIVEQLALLKGLIPEQKDPLEGIIAMMGITEKLKESAVGDAPLAEGSMAQLLALGGKLVEAAKNAPPKNAPQNVATENVATENVATENVNDTDSYGVKNDMNFLLKQKLKSHLDLLCVKAGQGKSSALWCDLTLDEIPEQFYPQLIDMLGVNDDAGFEMLMSINNRVSEHKIWFLEFLAHIRAAFDGDSGDSDGKEEGLTNDGALSDDSETIAQLPEINVDNSEKKD